jgi:hypothetical protein
MKKLSSLLLPVLLLVMAQTDLNAQTQYSQVRIHSFSVRFVTD